MLKYFAVNLLGNMSNKMCEPSSGGIGSRLKTDKKMFRNTPYHIKFTTKACGDPSQVSVIPNKMKNKTANKKFENGPAKETTASAFNGSLKLRLSIGTGLAQPISAKPEANAAIGISTDPMRSICLSGFNVNLPNFLAVSSPYLFASKA